MLGVQLRVFGNNTPFGHGSDTLREDKMGAFRTRFSTPGDDL
jgi:hypothetical protein